MLHVVEVKEAAEEAEAIARVGVLTGSSNALGGHIDTMLLFNRYLKIFETRSNFRTVVRETGLKN